MPIENLNFITKYGNDDDNNAQLDRLGSSHWQKRKATAKNKIKVAAKKLHPESKYAEFDLDGDGVVSDEEILRSQEMMELELREEKAEAQQKMAWIAMGSMLIFSIVLFTPIVTESRVAALADLLGLFYIAQAGVVGAYMGTSAWMSKK